MRFGRREVNNFQNIRYTEKDNMNSKAEQDYWTASAQSFKWQVKSRTVQVSDQDITEIPLGFQPFGISSLGDRVLITDYFAPAVCMNRVTVDGNTLRFEVAWIHGAQNGITRCRGGFPDMAYPSGANRCCTAFFGPDCKSVCIGRLDREFFLLVPEDSAQWHLAARISLPECRDFPFIHSAALNQRLNLLLTVESDAAMNKWRLAPYMWHEGWVTHSPKFELLEQHGIPRFHYGIAYLRGEPVTVASSHSVRGPNRTDPGIYIDCKLVVPGIVGSGICILPNGGALVAAYGQEEEGAHKGNPGKLIYVPPALLQYE